MDLNLIKNKKGYILYEEKIKDAAYYICSIERII